VDWAYPLAVFPPKVFFMHLFVTAIFRFPRFLEFFPFRGASEFGLVFDIKGFPFLLLRSPSLLDAHREGIYNAHHPPMGSTFLFSFFHISVFPPFPPTFFPFIDFLSAILCNILTNLRLWQIHLFSQWNAASNLFSAPHISLSKVTPPPPFALREITA